MPARTKHTTNWPYVFGSLLLLVGVYTLISVLTFDVADHPFYTSHVNTPLANKGGLVGAWLAYWSRFLFGQSAYIIPVLCFMWAGCFFARQVPRERWIKGLGLLLLLTGAATLCGIIWRSSNDLMAGGVLGYYFAQKLMRYCGVVGATLVASFSILIALTIATEFLTAPWIHRTWLALFKFLRMFAMKIYEALLGIVKSLAKARQCQPKTREAGKQTPPRAGEVLDEHTHVPPKIRQYRPGAEIEQMERAARVNPQAPPTGTNRERVRSKEPETPAPPAPKVKDRERQTSVQVATGEQADPASYEFPPIDLLDAPRQRQASTRGLEENSKIIQTTLREFGIDVQVTEIEQGPVITRYELLPGPGVKVQSILTRQDDLALSLRAKSLRVLAPIPGKAAVGIEVPNEDAHTVCLRELITQPDLKRKMPRLPLLLGKDTSGKPLVADLSDMPHILIAGTTGSGKTVCVNSLIAGLLYFLTPGQLKFIMVDPKMVELAVYNNLPHMLSPVVTDAKRAAATLNWIVLEMENRYKLLAHCGVRNIAGFNGRARKEGETDGAGKPMPAHMPYIVVIIDELADLMLVAQDKVENAIGRLAQLSRAVGIHLVLATQRPSVDVITGVIKANFPARISFKVASKIDSRTVLDMNGADRLLGRGDMLFLEPGMAEPTRGQAAWVSDTEINRIVEFYKKKGKPEYIEGIHEAQQSTGRETSDEEKDDVYDEAVDVVLSTGIASVSHLQRRLRLGYSRAARLIDIMELEGIVGPPQGSKPREIMRKIAPEPAAE